MFAVTSTNKEDRKSASWALWYFSSSSDSTVAFAFRNSQIIMMSSSHNDDDDHHNDGVNNSDNDNNSSNSKGTNSPANNDDGGGDNDNRVNVTNNDNNNTRLNNVKQCCINNGNKNNEQNNDDDGCTTTTIEDFNNEDITLHIASYLTAKELLQFQCVNSHTSQLDTNNVWKDLCKHRWKNWPRYKLTKEKIDDYESVMSNITWKQHYMRIEIDATRKTLTQNDLIHLQWYISFNLNGMREETRSEFQPIHFIPPNTLMVPGYQLLPYEIINDAPPIPAESFIRRRSLCGDNNPFSNNQWLRISNFPPHYITRKTFDAEWLIVNQNVTMISSSSTSSSNNSSSSDN